MVSLSSSAGESRFLVDLWAATTYVLCRRFGLEGLITFKRENRYDPDNYEIFVPHDPSNPNSPEAKIGVFDKVTVEITVEKVSSSLARSDNRYDANGPFYCRTSNHSVAE